MRRLKDLLIDLERERSTVAGQLMKPFNDLSEQNFLAGKHAVLEAWSNRIAWALSNPDDETADG